MTKQELTAKLAAIHDRGYTEDGHEAGTDTMWDHIEADKLLLEYINHGEVNRIFNAIYKWYA